MSAEQGRMRFVISMMGAQGMGKSSLAKKWFERYQGDKFVLTFNDEWGAYNRLPVEAYEDARKLEPWIRENISGHSRGPCLEPRPDGSCPHEPRHARLVTPKGAMLLFDDCEDIIPNHSGPSAYSPLWWRNRHLRLDIICIGHMSQAMNKQMLGMSHEIWIFAMEEPGTLKYLSRIPSIGDLGTTKIPSKPGWALRVQLRPKKRITLVNTFAAPRATGTEMGK